MKVNADLELEAENVLDRIEHWPPDSFGDLMRFLRDALEGDGVFEIESKHWGNRFFVNDGAVESNVALMAALRRNRPFWEAHWRCSSLIGSRSHGRVIRHEFHIVKRKQ